MAQNIAQRVETLIRSRYPILYLVSHEEDKCQEMMRQIAKRMEKEIFVYNVNEGLLDSRLQVVDEATRDQRRGAIVTLNLIDRSDASAIYLLKDFHPFICEPLVKRLMRDIAERLKTSYKTLVVLSPVLELPSSLEKDVTIIDVPMPGFDEMKEVLDRVSSAVIENPQRCLSLDEAGSEKLIKAALGLTESEAENAFARAIVEHDGLNDQAIDSVVKEKKQVIRKTGALDYITGTERLSVVGGLDSLKQWLGKRSRAFTNKAREFGIPSPKGVLLIGVPGCGKSLSAKAVAAEWQLPLLHLDVGKLFGSLVGESERNIRRTIQIAESIAPCVLWLDEIEKGFSSIMRALDTGVSARVFGTFITWLQEKTAPVFIVATANDVTHLPPELLRKGRFDEVFFVNLPGPEARKEIIAIQLKKRHRSPVQFDLDCLAQATVGFSGSEIEQMVVDGLYRAFQRNNREDAFKREDGKWTYQGAEDLCTEDLVSAAGEIIPLSQTMKEKLAKLRAWAIDRARNASSEEPDDGQQPSETWCYGAHSSMESLPADVLEQMASEKGQS